MENSIMLILFLIMERIVFISNISISTILSVHKREVYKKQCLKLEYVQILCLKKNSLSKYTDFHFVFFSYVFHGFHGAARS